MRREHFIARATLDARMLWSPTRAGSLLEVLVRRRDEAEFGRLLPDTLVDIGDEIRLYEIDPGDEAGMRSLNATYTASHYVGIPPGPWPDENAIIDALVPLRDARLLEVCCGAGRLGGALLRQGNRVVALDVSVACLRHAVRSDASGVMYVAGDALKLPFADGSFDVGCVFENSLGVLFSDKARAVDELVRVSRARVILGLRDAGPETLHVYHSPAGEIEIAETFTLPSVTALLKSLSPATQARIVGRQFRPGLDRPWGGRAFFVVLELDQRQKKD